MSNFCDFLVVLNCAPGNPDTAGIVYLKHLPDLHIHYNVLLVGHDVREMAESVRRVAVVWRDEAPVVGVLDILPFDVRLAGKDLVLPSLEALGEEDGCREPPQNPVNQRCYCDF